MYFLVNNLFKDPFLSLESLRKNIVFTLQLGILAKFSF